MGDVSLFGPEIKPGLILGDPNEKAFYTIFNGEKILNDSEKPEKFYIVIQLYKPHSLYRGFKIQPWHSPSILEEAFEVLDESKFNKITSQIKDNKSTRRKCEEKGLDLGNLYREHLYFEKRDFGKPTRKYFRYLNSLFI